MIASNRKLSSTHNLLWGGLSMGDMDQAKYNIYNSSQVHGGSRQHKHMCNAQVITREQTTETSDRHEIWYILVLF